MTVSSQLSAETITV